ncbi:TPA: hypothetical protein M5879_004350 [Citrobacter koseri]|uniref:hypothetical protein n=1 Tax=Citrobacter koseri TaxID=545 RepID=UPI00388FE057|nr:hypothetical protein [Citrobacter koseri]
MRAGLVSRAGWIACMLVTAGLSLFPGSERETTEPGCLPVPELRVVTVSEQGGAPAGLTYISLRGTAWGAVYSLYPERDGEGPLKVESLLGDKRGGVHART